MNTRFATCLGLPALLLAGSAITAPVRTYAEPFDIGACAAGASPHMVSNVYLQSIAGIGLPSPTSSTTPSVPPEYGYVVYAQGLSPVSQPGTQAPPQALFTFITTVTGSAANPTGFVPSTTVFNTIGHSDIAALLRTMPSFFTRSGTTTVYMANRHSAQFLDPTSFGSGTPILSYSFNQSVYVSAPGPAIGQTVATPFKLSVDSSGTVVQIPVQIPSGQSTPAQDFTALGQSTITASSPFSLGGTCYQLGSVGQQLSQAAAGLVFGPSIFANQIVGTNPFYGGYTASLLSAGAVTPATSSGGTAAR